MLLTEENLLKIKKSIAYAIETEDEAAIILDILSKEDWGKWVDKTLACKKWDLPCLVCNQIHRTSKGPLTGICRQCLNEGKGTSIQHSVAFQRSRANLFETPCTLTLKEWWITLEYFEWHCAYCLENKYFVIEHFIPLQLGGGTTAENCVPACYKCNITKNNFHPDNVAHKFLPGAIERVKDYLSGDGSIRREVRAKKAG